MNDHDSHGNPDHLDPHLGERMHHAVGGLRAPDVLSDAIARGERQRTRRRVGYGAVGVAAATALVLTVPALADGWSGRSQDPSTSLAATPSPSTTPRPLDDVSTAPTAPAAGGGDRGCDASTRGWWSKSGEQVEVDLAALLPAGVRFGRTEDGWTGGWSGNLVAGDDEDFASVTLLPPAGIPAGIRTLQEVRDLGPCVGGPNEPSQAIKPCAELDGVEACQEIRSEDGALIGVVTQKVEQRTFGDDGPTDSTWTYVQATLADPDGGYVELYVADGTRSDAPDTVQDPDDVPAVTLDQARAIVTDPRWTS